MDPIGLVDNSGDRWVKFDADNDEVLSYLGLLR